MIEPAGDETLDAILGGAIRLFQPRRGYRFSVEAVLLGRFATARADERVLELGAGCGVVALILARIGAPREVVALELQPVLAALVDRNAELNELTCVRTIRGDVRNRRALGKVESGFDLVVANPPFRARQSGRESPDPGRRAARAEGEATLDDFVAAAARWARHGGRVAIVFAAPRSAELIASLRMHRLEPKRIRFVHPRDGAPASAILVEARKGAGVEVAVEPPLMMYDAPGVYSAEARALLERP